MAEVVEGTFRNGEPYLRVGAGRPLVYLSGFNTEHANPRAFGRRLTLWTLRKFVDAGFVVYYTGRAPNLAPTTTFPDLAASLADGIADHFAAPADILGHSTGGSLVLQTIADRPEVVRKAVVASAAYQLGPVGRRAQAELVLGLEKDGRFPAHLLAEGFTRNHLLQRLIATVLRPLALGRVDRPADPIVVLRAEDAFDVRDRLPDVLTQTMVIGGARDYFYTAELFAETASLMPNGTLTLYPDRGHNIVISARFAADVIAFLG